MFSTTRRRRGYAKGGRSLFFFVCVCVFGHLFVTILTLFFLVVFGQLFSLSPFASPLLRQGALFFGNHTVCRITVNRLHLVRHAASEFSHSSSHGLAALRY